MGGWTLDDLDALPMEVYDLILQEMPKATDGD